MADETLPDDTAALNSIARSEQAAANALAVDLLGRDSAKQLLRDLEDAALKYGLPIVEKAAPVLIQLLLAAL